MTRADLLRQLADEVEQREALETEVLRLKTELVDAKLAMLATDQEPNLATNEAAKYLGISTSTLNQDRLRPKPRVPFIRIGDKAVRYSRAALDEFLRSGARGGRKAA